MKIYVITNGIYDDYSIIYVTESKEKADAFINRHKELYPNASKFNKFDVEEFDTDDMPVVTPRSRFWYVEEDYVWERDEANHQSVYVPTGLYNVRKCDEYECAFGIIAESGEEAIGIYKRRENESSDF